MAAPGCLGNELLPVKTVGKNGGKVFPSGSLVSLCSSNARGHEGLSEKAGLLGLPRTIADGITPRIADGESPYLESG